MHSGQECHMSDAVSCSVHQGGGIGSLLVPLLVMLTLNLVDVVPARSIVV